MICSSLNLELFIVRPLSGSGLYLNLEEVQGLRSTTLVIVAYPLLTISNSFTQMAVILLFSSASPNADLQVNGANGRLFVGEPRLRTQPKSG